MMVEAGDSQGGRANRSSAALHKDIVEMLNRHCDLAEVSGSGITTTEAMTRMLQNQLAQVRFPPRNGVFVQNARVGVGIYGDPFKLHFVLLRHGWKVPMALLAFTQESGGSTDMRIPGILESALKACPAWLVGLVLVGPELTRPGVVGYFRNKQLETRSRLRRVFCSSDELRQWALAGCNLNIGA